MWKSSLLLLLIIVVIIDAASVRKQPDKVINKSPAKSVENSDEDIDWECGTEGFSKIWSYQMINESCPHLLNDVNNCCVHHDKCYDDQKGQKNCDNIFCKCLRRVTYSPDNSTQECHEEHAAFFCESVQTFGDSFYEAAGNRTSLKDDPKPTLIKINLNETDVDKTVGHVRIYESKLHQTDRAFGGLSDLDTLT